MIRTCDFCSKPKTIIWELENDPRICCIDCISENDIDLEQAMHQMFRRPHYEMTGEDWAHYIGVQEEHTVGLQSGVTCYGCGGKRLMINLDQFGNPIRNYSPLLCYKCNEPPQTQDPWRNPGDQYDTVLFSRYLNRTLKVPLEKQNPRPCYLCSGSVSAIDCHASDARREAPVHLICRLHWTVPIGVSGLNWTGELDLASCPGVPVQAQKTCYVCGSGNKIHVSSIGNVRVDMDCLETINSYFDPWKIVWTADQGRAKEFWADEVFLEEYFGLPIKELRPDQKPSKPKGTANLNGDRFRSPTSGARAS